MIDPKSKLTTPHDLVGDRVLDRRIGEVVTKRAELERKQTEQVILDALGGNVEQLKVLFGDAPANVSTYLSGKLELLAQNASGLRTNHEGQREALRKTEKGLVDLAQLTVDFDALKVLSQSATKEPQALQLKLQSILTATRYLDVGAIEHLPGLEHVDKAGLHKVADSARRLTVDALLDALPKIPASDLAARKDVITQIVARGTELMHFGFVPRLAEKLGELPVKEFDALEAHVAHALVHEGGVKYDATRLLALFVQMEKNPEAPIARVGIGILLAAYPMIEGISGGLSWFELGPNTRFAAEQERRRREGV